jgi:opacity protein-like surface antigen
MHPGPQASGRPVSDPHPSLSSKEKYELSGELAKSITPWPGGHVKIRILVSAVAGVAMSATVAAAQVCQGDLSFRSSSTHVGGTLGLSDNTTSFGGGVTFGHRQGWYTGASLGMMTYDGLDGNTIAVGGGLGYQMPLQAKSKWQVCPGGTLSLGFGPSIDVGGNSMKTSSQAVSMGASFGTALPLSKKVNLLPFGSVGVGHTRLSAKMNGTSTSESETYLLLGAGAGFQLTPSLVLRPALTIAAGADLSDDTLFSFGVTWALPR